MNDRGEYRTIFCSFGDDPDVHDLSGDAVKLLVLLKLDLPPTGIGVAYPTMYAEKMRRPTIALEVVLEELERPKTESEWGWIARQRNVVWIVNALKFDLSLVPTNKKKHVPYVHRLVAELDPKLDVVRAFKWHYKEWFPDAPKSNWKPPRIATDDRVSDTLSHRVSDRVSGDRVSDTLSIPRSLPNKSLTEQDHNSGDLGKERGAARTPSPPFDRPGVAEFGRMFYGAASRDRIRDVKRQLRASVNGGVLLRRGVRVFAGSPERLEAKCREVVTEGVKDPDKAIVVLLTKLGDVGNADDSPTERAAEELKAEVKRDELDLARRLELAAAWLKLNPAASPAIDAEVQAEFDRNPVTGPFADMLRRTLYRSALLKAWTDAGEPIVAEQAP